MWWRWMEKDIFGSSTFIQNEVLFILVCWATFEFNLTHEELHVFFLMTIKETFWEMDVKKKKLKHLHTPLDRKHFVVSAFGDIDLRQNMRHDSFSNCPLNF